ncbi:hypothetical protein ATANTOWER_028722 [Ataeniobius toweri]|uniref:Uncharacterized protein n=1 Tax=Ataeniobius toweri TaxID=208326 RepID=A0ABU7A9Y0_9TELE|nr:hypothetical protein [Ataeniobius toweri]
MITKQSFRCSGCKCLQETSGNVAPCVKDGFTKGIRCMKLMSILVNFSCHPSPKCSQSTLDQGNAQDSPKSDVNLLEEVLCQAGSTGLLKNPVITTQKKVLSHEGCPLQHHIDSCCLTPCTT